ncbi:hypothetical protein C2S53_014766 [Perilla frutescens var. hirtella]|uniref:Protein kinase domain-containing protein n=1 Tax=Perilla frutescens var. hirtella TaxID=608512 RepID=A0AAD4P6P5_PERFH|nr:hypothetical protein C2S53_014766 [Perilla frutescens var. hirtella]
MAQQISWSKPNCQEKCGNVTIAYPFGIGPGCSANSSFAIICNSSIPFLSSINLEVVNISVHGVVIVNQPVSPMNCSDAMTVEFLPMSLGGSPFTISARYNSLAVLGCANSVWLLPNATTRVGVGGCMAICEDNSFTNSSCDGINCCTATIPQGLQSFVYRYRSIQSTTDGLCGYTFPVDKKWFQQDYKKYTGLQSNQSYPYDPGFEFAPLVLEWELENHTLNHLGECKYADTSRYSSYSSMNSYEQLYNDPSTSLFYSGYYDGYEYASSTQFCSCINGYEGNPYVDEGCVDINECAINFTAIRYEGCIGGICNTTTISMNRCGSTGTCINKIGGYSCQYPKDDNKSKIAFISVGSVLGALFLLFTAWMSARAIRKRIKAKRRQEFFKRNGGLLLQQQLSSTDSSLEKTKLFSYKELAQATDHYNENRILGRGGQGTVYKGMLTDGKIVAVKKSKKVEEGDLQDFINEVVILSQVNHQNVVRLLGCCLETEVPLLVYEFIPNGTLFELVHDPSEDFPLSWEMRLRIAREVAGALAYLHSAASVPIYHRDIKSTNILLDDKYRAKVSDFGASRSIAIDQTHLTTRVLGTFGYLDPEYFQSSQFTEKSDVYSFGVVMVELLTGEKAISSIRAEVGRSLATHFLHSMEENQLFDILDATVLEEGKREEIMSVAELARRCLHLNGKKRPTMKEVAIELEGIQMVKLKAEESINKQNQDSSSKECHAIEVDESYDFSSIAESMHFDANAITDYSQDDRRRLLDS